ncbi:MAG: hypothetical protein PHS86_11410 [Syntrophaceae bacterium]|nr:hypothetical protein [Syntrophaceae bacterium]
MLCNSPVDILPNINVDYLDDILLDGLYLKLLPASTYYDLDRTHLRVWANTRARYGFPTVELIQWLKDKFGGRFAIELGAGAGDLGYHLGIIQTDSFMQHRPELKAFYEAIRQGITHPPDDVYEYDALEAVEGLRPKVPVASWLTQLVSAEECKPETHGSVYGADEEAIIAKVEMYIHIGNEGSHAQKKALALPHEEFHFPWLVSRSSDWSKNVIYVWGK